MCIYDERSLNQQLEEYVNIRFPGLLIALEPDEKKQFLEELVYAVFTTRRNKGHTYLPDLKKKQTKEMWNTIVEIKDSFTITKLSKFVDVPTFSFLATWFCLNIVSNSVNDTFEGRDDVG